MPVRERYRFTANEGQAGRRLDKVLAELFPDYSRALLQRNIRKGRVHRMDGTVLKPAHVLSRGESLVFEPEPRQLDDAVAAQPLPLNIVHEDDAVIIIDKPPGLVAHPAAGHRDGTLVNGLLAHNAALRALPRAGLIHRLDKDTSGLLAAAKTAAAYQALTTMMQKREVRREYQCLVCSALVSGAAIDAPIGRHPRDRKRMTVVEDERYGRKAVTRYRVVERFERHALLHVVLETGRTHQIRVHMAHIGACVFGDPVYGGRFQPPPGMSEAQREALRSFRRQALHASRLAFTHPGSGETAAYESPLPDDLAGILDILRSVGSR